MYRLDLKKCKSYEKKNWSYKIRDVFIDIYEMLRGSLEFVMNGRIYPHETQAADIYV